MARGDEALAGIEEKNIPSHMFPPDNTKDRIINFKGEYLSIAHRVKEHEKTRIVNDPPSTDYVPYEVPAGYTCEVIGASVYFKV